MCHWLRCLVKHFKNPHILEDKLIETNFDYPHGAEWPVSLQDIV